MSHYRLTCLTPTLVGDGSRLSPIDYMIWRDQVNVLDQNRIFRMLAKGPRLDSYLTQIRKADRLKFAEWGGYAQNYAARRIPLENPSLARLWESARLESLHIPTFASGAQGPYLPASALKGALRTAHIWAQWRDRASPILEAAAKKLASDRAPRRLAQGLEPAPAPWSLSDGRPEQAAFRIYYLRTALLESGLSWKDTAPSFLEMAAPGSTFVGRIESRQPADLRAAAGWSTALLEMHLAYAKAARLPALAASLEGLRFKAATLGSNACLLALGWGTGFLSKAALLDTRQPAYRAILRALPLYAKAIQSGLPFPKTRRIVHVSDQPAALPGWVLLELTD